MRKRPLLLFLFAAAFLYFPFEVAARYYAYGKFNLVDFIISGILPFFLLFGLIRVTKIGWYTLVGVVSLLGVRDLQVYYAAQGSVTSFLVHIVIFLFSLSYFINPRIRHLYFDPKLRWWRTKRRYETHLPFLMNGKSGWQYPILRNISEGGCFVETPHPMEMSEFVNILIPLPVPLGVSVLKARGEVRWASPSGRRPGMGIQFQPLDPLHDKALKEFVRNEL
jgi:hypothetical protein